MERHSGEKIKAALLIDADNLPTGQVVEAIQKLEEICSPVVRKAFGDFTNSAKNWDASFLLEWGLTPVQHFPVTKFKNGADIAMCIAAMDIVHMGNIDAIILFSSDSDFGPLASRVREAGVEVIGVGDQQTNDKFRASFDTFIVVKPPEVIPIPQAEKPNKTQANKTTAPKKVSSLPARKVAPTITKSRPSKARRKIIVEVVSKLSTPNEGALLSKVNAELKQHIKGFSPKSYGYASISKFMNSLSEVVLTNGNKSVQLSKGVGSDLTQTAEKKDVI